MTTEAWGMTGAGVAALLAGLALAWRRFEATSGAARILVLGPICDAIAIAMFSAEHFTAAHDLAPLVPHWLPHPLFWTYLFGAGLLGAAIGFIAWRYVRFSALVLALQMLLVVVLIDVPSVPKGMHERLFWTLFVRELAFACGALVLAGSVWPRASAAGRALVRIGRGILVPILFFYAIEHFLFPLFVPGVPLEMHTPAWMPTPVLISWIVGTALLLASVGLLLRPQLAAAGAGVVLVLLTVFFYGSILMTEIHTPRVIEGLNYVGDTLFFAGTILLAGLGGARVGAEETSSLPTGLESAAVHQNS